MKIGITELVVVFIVALFVLGPDKLPAYARKLGQALAEFRKYSEAATKDIKESIVEPLEEAQKPLREAVEPLQELDREVRGNVKDLQDSFAGIGKPKKEKKPAAPAKDSPDEPEGTQAEEPVRTLAEESVGTQAKEPVSVDPDEICEKIVEKEELA